MELWGVPSEFAVGIVSYARTTIIHDYFIAITFAGSLGRYLNTRPSGLMFKQLTRDPANVNARKTMGDPYNKSLNLTIGYIGEEC